MNDSLKNILIFTGVLAVLYVMFRYVLPVVFKVLGFILGILLYVAVGGLIILAIIWFFTFITDKMKNS